VTIGTLLKPVHERARTDVRPRPVRRSPLPFASLWRSQAIFLAFLGPAFACSRGEPPTWDGGSLAVVPLPSTAVAAPPSLPDAASRPHAHEAGVDSGPPVDPATLPQTRERPREGPPFQARAVALWDAIVKDDADTALPFFFPLGAYRQVKAIPNPEGDWRRRLVSAFRRDIHELHEKLGSHVADSKLVELEVATERGHWVEPGEEGNKLGYWRVYGSKLRYQTDRGAGAFDVRSLISWRGEWYVVHLSGFR